MTLPLRRLFVASLLLAPLSANASPVVLFLHMEGDGDCWLPGGYTPSTGMADIRVAFDSLLPPTDLRVDGSWGWIPSDEPYPRFPGQMGNGAPEVSVALWMGGGSWGVSLGETYAESHDHDSALQDGIIVSGVDHTERADGTTAWAVAATLMTTQDVYHQFSYQLPTFVAPELRYVTGSSYVRVDWDHGWHTCTLNAALNSGPGFFELDGDGVPDAFDLCPGVSAAGYDLNRDGCVDDGDGDGVPDHLDACPLVDASGQDLDSDGCVDDADADGVWDGADFCPVEDASGFDADLDGCLDDTDGDTVTDDLDLCPLVDALGLDVNLDGCVDDADLDGFPDLGDLCPTVAAGPYDLNGDGCPDDGDGDGVPDALDLCPTEDASAVDNNHDGCLDDFDGDGIPDPFDRCAGVAAGAFDTNHDGCPDDTDGDGVPDVSDNCRTRANPTQADADQDGRGDACDLEGSVRGSDCPGQLTVTVRGLTPRGRYALLRGHSGATTVPSGACAGTVVPVGGAALIGAYLAPPTGTALFSPTLAAPMCGTVVVALDLTTCQATPAFVLDGST